MILVRGTGKHLKPGIYIDTLVGVLTVRKLNG